MADTYDVISLDEGKSVTGVKGSAQDTQLAMYITAVSRRLDKACGAIVTRTVTAERHHGGHKKIRLRHPVLTFTSVTEYQGTTAVTLTAETLGTAPGDGYLAEPHDPDPALSSGVLVRRSGGYDSIWWPGRRNIAVTYSAGRYANTAAVDARFKDAALIMLHNLWGNEEPTVALLGDDEGFRTPGGRFPTFAVPKAAKALLRDEWRETPGMSG